MMSTSLSVCSKAGEGAMLRWKVRALLCENLEMKMQSKKDYKQDHQAPTTVRV